MIKPYYGKTSSRWIVSIVFNNGSSPEDADVYRLGQVTDLSKVNDLVADCAGYITNLASEYELSADKEFPWNRGQYEIRVSNVKHLLFEEQRGTEDDCQ